MAVSCSAVVGTASSDAASGHARAATAARKTYSINFGLASVNMLYAPYIVGEAAGIFAKNGIKLNIVLTKDAATAEAAVSADQTPIGAITTDAIAIAHNSNVAIAMPVVTGTPYSLVVSSKINSVADLRNRSLGASGLATADGGIIRTMLQHYGMTVGTDYNIIITGDPAARTASLLNGQVVGIAAPEPQLTILKRQGFKELIRASTVPGLATRPFNMITVNRGWAKKNPAAVVAFEKAWLQSVKYMYSNPNKSIADLATGLNTSTADMTDAYGDWIISQKVFPTSCVVTAKSLQNVINAQISLGSIQSPGPDPAKLVLGGTYCNQAMGIKTTK
ncbi:MAG TPA: ABC transporter substrate-binding protein [Solirubrobacteraceae bacterium]|nr:ABC transporter substrate-binding protein [Solirubrobacteraceae bacterium]